MAEISTSILTIDTRIFMEFPKRPLLFLLPYKNTKRIKMSNYPWPVICPRSPYELGRAISCQVDEGVLGQIVPWMSYIPQDRVEEHDRRLEDIEEPLIPQDGTQSHQIVSFWRRATGFFYHAVNTTYEDQRRTHVQCNQRRRDLGVKIGSYTSPMKNPCEDGKDGDNDELHCEGNHCQGASDILIALRCTLIGEQGYTCSVQAFNDCRQSTENGQDSTWIKGREVWDVVQCSTEDMVIREFKKRAI